MAKKKNSPNKKEALELKNEDLIINKNINEIAKFKLGIFLAEMNFLLKDFGLQADVENLKLVYKKIQ